MDLTELIARLKALSGLMLAKGYPMPRVSFVTDSDAKNHVLLGYLGAEPEWPTIDGTVYHAQGGDLSTRLADAEAWIAAAPMFAEAA